MVKKNKIIIFRIDENESDRLEKLIKKIKTNSNNIIKQVGIDKSKFYRLFFSEGMNSIEKKLHKPNICEKCGKPLAISVPRHLRNRIDVCKCGDK